MSESFSIESVQMQALSSRVDELTRWLTDRAHYCEAEQKHLDDGSLERLTGITVMYALFVTFYR